MIISSYLDGSGMISLAQACEFGSVRLLDRIWEASDPVAAAKSSSWSLCWYLRTNTHYYRYQFKESLRTAAGRGGLELVRWILDHFSGCLAAEDAVEAAAQSGCLEILQYLLEYSNEEVTKVDHGRNAIVWRGDDVANAIDGRHGEVARWLYEHFPGVERDLSRVMEFAVRRGELTVVQWLLEDVYTPELDLPPPSMNDAAAGGHIEMLQWVFEQGYYGGSDRALEGAAKNGHLEMVVWLVGKWITKGAREALQTACGGGDLGIVRFLLERKLVQDPHFALNYAVRGGHLEIVQYLSEVEIVCEPSKMMIDAASSGHLDVVEWLVDKFGVTASLFPASDPSRTSWFTNTAMDGAATNGHLHVLKFLYSLAVKMQAEGKTEIPTLSQCALSSAATMSHFEVVKWIRTRYPQLPFEPHTTSSVARNGNLEMLQWLHRQPNIEWTTDVMASAAENGHLTVIKWLHENRIEGCTSTAMDEATRNGHFKVVRWLHHNCLVEGTSTTMHFAVHAANFELLLFLRARYAVWCTSTALLLARKPTQPHILAWGHN